MKVLLKQDVDNLGLAGEVHKVAPGFGRNYLIPKDMAVIATSKTLKQADAWRKKAETRREELKAEYAALAAKIEDVTLTFTARAGENGRLYGSVTTTQITDELNERLGTEIDRRKVGEEALRQLGSHQVVVRLSGDFQPYVTVVIESEDGVQVAPETPAEEELQAAEVEDEPEANEEASE